MIKNAETEIEQILIFIHMSDIIRGARKKAGTAMNQNIHMPAEEEIYYLSEFYKVFGDSTRIKSLYILLDQELCVNDIAQALSMTPSSISHQLRILKQHRLVKFRRDGKTIYYSLADHHVENILSQGLEHIEE